MNEGAKFGGGKQSLSDETGLEGGEQTLNAGTEFRAEDDFFCSGRKAEDRKVRLNVVPEFCKREKRCLPRGVFLRRGVEAAPAFRQGLRQSPLFLL